MADPYHVKSFAGVHYELPFHDAVRDSSDFANELRREVHQHFESLGITHKANLAQKMKVGLIVTGVLVSYLLLMFAPHSPFAVFLLLLSMSFWASAWGFNIGHEAAHNSIFENPILARFVRYSFDVIGISSSIFKRKHVFFHHQYTNKATIDGDMEEAYPLFRLNSYRAVLGHHRFQAYYAMVAYSFLTVFWIWRDDWLRVKNSKIAETPMLPLTRRERVEFLILKLSHAFVFLVLPALRFPFWNVIGCYLFVHLLAGFFVTLVFQIAHIFENCLELGQYHFSSWYRDQVLQTRNFAVTNSFCNWYLGGLNFQIEHHVFPYVSSCHYPAISPIVRRVCDRHQIPYRFEGGFLAAVVAHLSALKKLGLQRDTTGELVLAPISH